MKKLTDVYIKVTKQNYEDCDKLFKFKYNIGTYIIFLYNDFNSYQSRTVEPKNKQKVSLTELKRLIDTIPTREEIKRLKQQISAIRMNYDKVVKHSLSKEDVIEKLDNAVVEQKKIITRQINEIHNLKESRDKWITLGEKLTKEKESFKQQKEVTDKIIHSKNDEIKFLNSRIDTLIWDINRVKQENAQLKQRKWWQIWK